jgi:hypothetical protein
MHLQVSKSLSTPGRDAGCEHLTHNPFREKNGWGGAGQRSNCYLNNTLSRNLEQIVSIKPRNAKGRWTVQIVGTGSTGGRGANCQRIERNRWDVIRAMAFDQDFLLQFLELRIGAGVQF